MDIKNEEEPRRTTRRGKARAASSASEKKKPPAPKKQKKKRRGGNDIPEPAAKRQTRTSTASRNKKSNDKLLAASPLHSNAITAITPVSAHPREAGPVRRLNDPQQLPATQPPSSVKLPPQVPNIFSFPNNKTRNGYYQHSPCQCSMSGAVSPPVPCAGRCISAAFMDSYGWEYKALLRRAEMCEVGPFHNDWDNHEDCKDDDEDTRDPFRHLIPSGIVVPPPKRTREVSEWSAPEYASYCCDDYMDRQPDLNSKMRNILVDWIVELVEEYKLSESTFHLAITLIDKSLSCTPPSRYSEEEGKAANFFNNGKGFIVARDMLQCLGCACTWIAAKIEEVVPPSVDDFVYISDNIYSAEQIRQMEMDVCMALRFKLQHVTPFHYSHEYLLASEQHSRNMSIGVSSSFCGGPAFHPLMRHMVEYLLQLSRFPYEFVDTKSSLIAASVLFLARATLGICDTSPDAAAHNKGYWTKTLQYYTGYKVEQLKDAVRILLTYHQEAEKSALKAVFKKYSKAKFCHVSTKTVLDKDDLDLECFVSIMDK